MDAPVLYVAGSSIIYVQGRRDFSNGQVRVLQSSFANLLPEGDRQFWGSLVGGAPTHRLDTRHLTVAITSALTYHGSRSNEQEATQPSRLPTRIVLSL